MPKNEDFALIFYVLCNGDECQYEYKVDASDEENAIAVAPEQLRKAEQHLGGIANNPILVKVLSRLSIR